MNETYGLDDFIAEARTGIAERHGPAAVLEALSPGFMRLLGNPAFLEDRIAEIGSRSDEVCLHAEPNDGFVVLARGAAKKQPSQGKSHAVVPHDHGPLWALYGVYEGSSNLQRWAPDDAEKSGPFPGLKLESERFSEAGQMDAVQPHNMHLPVHTPGAETIILVVYDCPLDSVVRRGYVAAGKTVVDFQGVFPPLEVPVG
jgi:predicted metal-dependent enzyme (double-stranded beta helix superfamily)